MAEFSDFDLEIQDEKQSSIEHYNGNVATAGSPITLTHTSGNVQLAYIAVNSIREPNNPNGINDAILFSLDNGTTYSSLMSGESIFIPGIFSNIKLDTNNNGTYYQVILWA